MTKGYISPACVLFGGWSIQQTLAVLVDWATLQFQGKVSIHPSSLQEHVAGLGMMSDPEKLVIIAIVNENSPARGQLYGYCWALVHGHGLSQS